MLSLHYLLGLVLSVGFVFLIERGRPDCDALKSAFMVTLPILGLTILIDVVKLLIG